MPTCPFCRKSVEFVKLTRQTRVEYECPECRRLVECYLSEYHDYLREISTKYKSLISYTE